MGILDTFKGNQYKNELEKLKADHEKLLALTTPEVRQAFNLETRIMQLEQREMEYDNKFAQLNAQINTLQSDASNLEHQIALKKQQLVWLDEEELVQDFGLYRPRFDFASALDYKEALMQIRQEQKTMIKNKTAVTGNPSWTVNGDAKQGKKMVSDMQKLLLRAFNSECDELIGKVRYTNFDASLGRIYKSAEAISKHGEIMNISITQEYINSKSKELRLAFEYQLKKQQEKEELKEARAEQREQKKIQQELEQERRKIEKEQNHYLTAYERIKKQLEQNPDDTDLLEKKNALENQLDDIDKAICNIDYRQANMRAGYVYVISNIGSFGKDVYKIGMTRRLDPQDRVDELGDASVPFRFDVHAMIFSDDAPALETALHKAFSDKKVNMVNQRREFFHVTLDEIKEVIKNNFDKTVEFIDVPDAEQYRISEKIRNGEIVQ